MLERASESSGSSSSSEAEKTTTDNALSLLSEAADLARSDLHARRKEIVEKIKSRMKETASAAEKRKECIHEEEEERQKQAPAEEGASKNNYHHMRRSTDNFFFIPFSKHKMSVFVTPVARDGGA